jgi:alpha-N-arabinofuranosidase
MIILFTFNCISCVDGTNIAENFDGTNKIVIDFRNDIGKVNKKLFGNNFVGYDPVLCKFRDKEYYGHMDYGEGIWDPKQGESVKEVVDLAKEAGITIIRFPGGCGTHHYNWKAAIGKERKHFLYGIDEFLKTCAEIGAEPVITVSYFTGNEQDASDLVEYLNSPNDGGNPNSGINWAAQRAKNGHPLPYKARYFEIGNEVWHGDHQNTKEVSPEEYAERYLKYYEKMKTVDPSIKIGCIVGNGKKKSRFWNCSYLSFSTGE